MLFKPYQFIPVANCNKRCRIITVFLSLSVISTLITITTALHFYLSLPTLPHTRGYENSPYIYTPRWTWGLFELFTGQPDLDFYAPTRFPKLLAAPPMQTWDTPSLPEGDALILLHIFSTGSPASRQRRELIRQNSPLDTIPPAYRQFVELNFILGCPKPGTETDEEVIQEEAEIEREIEKYGDIERLNGLMDGDNMNQGKSWEWTRWVGSRQGRKAQWVMKCDDDTFPVLPNLIDTLLGLDPTQPTYFGTSMEHWTGAHHYFEGMMYGFSWNVIKTLSAAKRNELAIHSQEHEDMHMGELMYSLPSIPDCKWQHGDKTCDPSTPPPGGWGRYPLSPDPRTGLVRYDFGRLLGPKVRWWVPENPAKAIGWHGLKEDQDYTKVYQTSMEYFTWEGLHLYTAKALQPLLRE